MSYLIAVLVDRIQAEAAYTALEKAGIATEKLSILGRGYKSADEFGFIDPAQQEQCKGQGPECEPLFHQPGGTTGNSEILQKVSGRTCKVVSRLIKEDVPELRRTTFRRRCPKGSSKIALVVHPGEDYHFYRQDPDGYWSHKDGANPVKRIDAEGKLIWNPQTAARDYRPRGSFLNYKDFCGFWCAPRRKTIRLARGGKPIRGIEKR